MTTAGPSTICQPPRLQEAQASGRGEADSDLRNAFIARQPIFDAQRRVFGYELLFRNSLRNAFDYSCVDEASTRVIADSSLLFGLEALTGGRKAFINLGREALLEGQLSLLPADRTVGEILESVEPDEEVVAACRRLKEQGYVLALDDFVYAERYEPLLELVDMIKVDFLETEPELQERMVEQLSPRGLQTVAEKVETYEEFARAVAMGYQYFRATSSPGPRWSAASACRVTS